MQVIQILHRGFRPMSFALAIIFVAFALFMSRYLAIGARNVRRTGVWFSSLLAVLIVGFQIAVITKVGGLAGVLTPSNHWLLAMLIISMGIAVAHAYAVLRLVYRP